jgi:hypothetical protein
MMGGCVWGGGWGDNPSKERAKFPQNKQDFICKRGSKRKNKKIFQIRVSFTEGKEEPLARSRPPQQERV